MVLIPIPESFNGQREPPRYKLFGRRLKNMLQEPDGLFKRVRECLEKLKP